MVDGKIIGENEKFSVIVNFNKNIERNESNYLEKLMFKKVTSVLSYGINNIDDINFSIDRETLTLRTCLLQACLFDKLFNNQFYGGVYSCIFVFII